MKHLLAETPDPSSSSNLLYLIIIGVGGSIATVASIAWGALQRKEKLLMKQLLEKHADLEARVKTLEDEKKAVEEENKILRDKVSTYTERERSVLAYLDVEGRTMDKRTLLKLLDPNATRFT